ncbi:MAG: CbiQ family ECF transporter T component [Thermoguttaceae bacterium]
MDDAKRGRRLPRNFDPRVKLAWSVAVSLVAVVLRHPAWLALLLAVAVAPWWMVRRPAIRPRWLLVVIGTTVIGGMVSQGLFYGAARTEWLRLLPGLSLCREGIVHGAVVSLRVLAALAAGGLVVFTTESSELVSAFRALRVPASLAMTLTLALRLLPEVASHGKRMLAEESPRDKGLLSAAKRFKRLLVPLLAISLHRAKCEALEAERQDAEPSGNSRRLSFTAIDWTAMAALTLMAATALGLSLLGYDAPLVGDPADSSWAYPAAVAGLLAVLAIALRFSPQSVRFRPFSLAELATAAALICMLRIAVLPWQIGLAKLPGLNALIFAIPYTVIFLIGLRLVPRPGFAVLLIVGQGLFGQLVGSGVNPAWWPYYLSCAFGAEGVFFLTGYRMQSLPALLAVGVTRGLIAGSYTFLIAAPYIWHKYYAPWYITLVIAMDALGCAVGAIMAWRVAPRIEKLANG